MTNEFHIFDQILKKKVKKPRLFVWQIIQNSSQQLWVLFLKLRKVKQKKYGDCNENNRNFSKLFHNFDVPIYLCIIIELGKTELTKEN